MQKQFLAFWKNRQRLRILVRRRPDGAAQQESCVCRLIDLHHGQEGGPSAVVCNSWLQRTARRVFSCSFMSFIKGVDYNIMLTPAQLNNSIRLNGSSFNVSSVVTYMHAIHHGTRYDGESTID